VAPDVGLDAVRVEDSGEILFSIETQIFSERLGVALHRGDLLSSTGKVVRTYQQMYEKFHTLTPPADYGLDSLYRWPGGEMWFSPEISFSDNQLGFISAGDIISDQGYVVFRNPQLLSSFAPVQGSKDFGVDALFVVTDATPPPGEAGFNISRKSGSSAVSLAWQSSGRVFQAERSVDLASPFEPVSPVIPDLSWDDAGGFSARPRAFYRLQQW
jgi:hypothetical protein